MKCFGTRATCLSKLKVKTTLHLMFVGLLCWAPVYADNCHEQVSSINKVDLRRMPPALAFPITSELNSLVDLAEPDAYELSMPFIIAATVNGQEPYQALNEKMLAALKDLPENSFKDWMRGRYLFADKTMNGGVTQSDMLSTLSKNLSDAKTVDNYTAWAWGYLGNLNSGSQSKMVEAVTAFSDSATANSSDKLWAWVMVMQASANAGNQTAYDMSISRINSLGGVASVPESDFPAWAISLARIASATMNDPVYFSSLQASMDAAMASARALEQSAIASQNKPALYKARAGKLLGQVNDRLALQRMDINKACRQ